MPFAMKSVAKQTELLTTMGLLLSSTSYSKKSAEKVPFFSIYTFKKYRDVGALQAALSAISIFIVHFLNEPLFWQDGTACSTGVL